VETLLSLFHVGQGCGQACITSADTEQIFEAAADDVYAAAKAGMITEAEAVAAIQWLQQQGDAQMANLAQSDSKAKSGQQNMDKTLQAEIAAVHGNTSIPISVPTAALNPTQLTSSVFIQPGTSGWYADAVSQGSSLALQAIADATNVTAAQAPAAAAGTATVSASGSLTSDVSSLFSGLSSTQLSIGVALIAAVFLMSRSRSGGSIQNPRRRKPSLRRRRFRAR